MKIIRSVKRMQAHSRKLAAFGKHIGLVPTMGYLHEGHLSLIRRAKRSADIVVVSVFVNPTQFGPGEDLARYPRDEKGDIRRIRQAGGDIAFAPPLREIYPAGFDTWVSVGRLAETLEGKHRPSHFRGVTTIVVKLFNIVRPSVVVFGMKDFQQAIVLRQMTRDLDYPVKFAIAPTVREPDGLAMSSRNRYFSGAARREAVCLFYALRSAKEMITAGIAETGKLAREMRAIIRATCPTARIEYIAFTELATLKPVKRVGKSTVCLLAVQVHGVRLIDNMKLT